MDQKSLPDTKNPYISLTKFIGSCMIVLIHIKFAGKIGDLIELAGRWAVPFFFGITGYFTFKTDSSRLIKRIKKLILILIITDILYLCWGIFYNTYVVHQSIRATVSSLVSLKKLALFLFLDKRTDCMTFHMWYITAQIKVYAALYLFLVFTDDRDNYTPLYYTASAAFLFFIIFGIDALASGISFDVSLTRNCLFYAFPVFMAGMFLHNHQQEIINRFHLNKPSLVILITVGYIFAFIEHYGIGKTEVPLGILFSVNCLIILLTGFSIHQVSENIRLTRHISDFESMSLIIYIIHPLVNYISGTFSSFSGQRLYPLFVLFITVLTAFLFTCIKKAFLSLKN